MRRPVAVSQEVREVLRLARQASEWTDGKFDITFGALSGLWKFDHDLDNRIPDRARTFSRACRSSTIRSVEVDDRAEHGVHLPGRECASHLGGIGKGYAVDRARGHSPRAADCTTS